MQILCLTIQELSQLKEEIKTQESEIWEQEKSVKDQKTILAEMRGDLIRKQLDWIVGTLSERVDSYLVPEAKAAEMVSVVYHYVRSLVDSEA